MPISLVTGGAGFIGSHLAEALLQQGHRVLVLDDLSSGSVKNITSLRSNPKFEFVPESISSLRVLAELVDLADVIFHLAATVGVFNIIESPVHTIVNNIGGTEAVLKAASKKKKKVIVASTSEVYGKSAEIPFREDGDLVFGPSSKSRWSYASSKVVDEFLALAYWREFKVPTVVARLFNTIGPRQTGHYGMVVPRFMLQALRGQNLTANDQSVGNIFNLGNDQEVSIEELARRIIAVVGTEAGIEYIPYEKAYEEGFEDMERRVPDITRIKALTGYAPRVSLDQALRLIRDWFVNEKILEDPAMLTHMATA